MHVNDCNLHVYNGTTFEDLNFGDAFKDDLDTIFMKCTTADYSIGVTLIGGIGRRFAPKEKVTRLNATVTVSLKTRE